MQILLFWLDSITEKVTSFDYRLMMQHKDQGFKHHHTVGARGHLWFEGFTVILPCCPLKLIDSIANHALHAFLCFLVSKFGALFLPWFLYCNDKFLPSKNHLTLPFSDLILSFTRNALSTFYPIRNKNQFIWSCVQSTATLFTWERVSRKKKSTMYVSMPLPLRYIMIIDHWHESVLTTPSSNKHLSGLANLTEHFAQCMHFLSAKAHRSETCCMIIEATVHCDCSETISFGYEYQVNAKWMTKLNCKKLQKFQHI